MRTITTTDIVNAYAERGGITKKEATERIRNVLELVGDAITECAYDLDTKLFLSGFGTFKAVVKPARTLKSNLTGETHEVPEKVVVKFKPSVGMYVEVNGL